MTHLKWLLAMGAILAVVPSTAFALTSDEVLVIADSGDAESVALAERYAQGRQIEQSHILRLKLKAAYSISREDYESQIRQPVMQYLLEKRLAAGIKCLVLVWPMPVRVEAPANSATSVNSLYAAEVTKCHYLLAIDYKLLATVGRKFPPPRTDGLTPVTDLFESPPPVPSEPLTEWSAMTADIDKVLSGKIGELKAIKDPNSREIASRQLLGLSMDIRGLEGMVRCITDAGITDAPDVAELRKQLDQAATRQNELRAKPVDAQSVAAMMASMKESAGLIGAGDYARKQMEQAATATTASASVDSELSLLWQGKYALENWVVNPLFWRVDRKSLPVNFAPVLMTCRLDGPTSGDVARIIRDSLQVEQTGLAGTFYIDAGGLERAKEYDKVFRELNGFLRAKTRLNVVFDEALTMFAPGTCPNAALYCGWYSLQKYIPAFSWVKGSVGWHVASFEAMHLRDPNSEEWCPKMVQNGIAATIGAVDEPRLAAFPNPEEFFAMLLTGKFTLAECYWRTVPLTSWRMTLIGDPLYNPFKTNPQVQLSDLPPQLTAPPLAPVSAVPTTASAPAGQDSTQSTSGPGR